MQETVVWLKFIPEVAIDARGTVTAICRELGLAAAGESQSEAIASLQHAVRSYCHALRRRGLVADALVESGIRWMAVPLERAGSELVVHIQLALEEAQS